MVSATTCFKRLILLFCEPLRVGKGMAVMIKLLMKWDIKAGHEQSYFEFVMQEFAPGLMRLGLQPTEAWYTVYGSAPQILTGAVTEDRATMDQILEGEEWQTLHKKLLTFVNNYTQKIVTAVGNFQL